MEVKTLKLVDVKTNSRQWIYYHWPHRSFGNGNNDAYLLKTDSEGNELWSRTYGGSGTDQGRHIVETLDQGYIISGYTDSYGSWEV